MASFHARSSHAPSHHRPSPVDLPGPMPLLFSFPPMAAIHSLPPELIRSIFELSVYSQPDPDHRLHSQHTAEVTISHVCHQWRQIALDNPLLWTQIHFRTKAHYERADKTPSKSIRPPLPRRLPPVFNVVLPYIRLWRELHLKVADLPCKQKAREVLSTCGVAPNLRTLQLWHVQDWQTPERLFNHIGPAPVVVFGGELPSLKHIILQGVNLPWHSSPFLRGLTSVEFALHSDNVRMPFSLWRDMLRQSPPSNAFPSTTLAPAPTPRTLSPPTALTDPVQLPALAEVDLHDLDPHYLVSLFRTIHAPNVRSLSLEMAIDDDDDETDEDAPDYAPFLHYLFPRLAHLAIASLPCSTDSWRAFLCSARELTSLAADFTRIRDGAFEVLFESVSAPGGADEDKDDKDKGKAHAEEAPDPAPTTEEPILPHLRTAHISGLECEELVRLADHRRAAGCPIGRWEVNIGYKDDNPAGWAAFAAALDAESEKARAAAEAAECGKGADGRVREPWRWDEPAERLVWVEDDEDGEGDGMGSDEDEDEEEEEGADGVDDEEDEDGEEDES
ncbi:uncharacterized protein BXZ73DRAFT_103246 [Epithele typhae]|uniref:uncharacterized protein n=1 Tax=Epithele typhae TaxID=378194 RepID=UPI00200821CC|nr:uncharacterized protein BXZ73DRAFT_103246 [Epithele typhae]KAH9925361.1 hypothetical protein BXZ73DRAFT_103246 [Epithele typhae]